MSLTDTAMHFDIVVPVKLQSGDSIGLLHKHCHSHTVKTFRDVTVLSTMVKDCAKGDLLLGVPRGLNILRKSRHQSQHEIGLSSTS